MKAVLLSYALFLPFLCFSQQVQDFPVGDKLDTYWGKRDPIRKANNVRVRIELSCTDSSMPAIPHIRTVFNKEGGIDSIIYGSDLSKGQISGIRVFQDL